MVVVPAFPPGMPLGEELLLGCGQGEPWKGDWRPQALHWLCYQQNELSLCALVSLNIHRVLS